MTYDNTNRGAIWKNEEKSEDTHPDFKGSLNVEGVEYFFDAWKRKPDANPKAPALSFRVKRKDKQPDAQIGNDHTQIGNAGGFDDDSIPF